MTKREKKVAKRLRKALHHLDEKDTIWLDNIWLEVLFGEYECR